MLLFKAESITHCFGGLKAVSNFNLGIAKGELLGLIGPNGAGKTTVFNLISGIYSPLQGRILFDNYEITGYLPYEIARLGIARTFQNIRLFHDMSVIDNIKTASRSRVEYGVFSSLFHSPSFWDKEHRLDDFCYNLLSIMGLESRASEPARSLPYGLQRRLEIARALALSPRLLLLDEPAAGMNPNEAAELVGTIHWVKKEFDLTVILIEHNMHVVMNTCDRIMVMDFGETIAEGTPEEIRRNPRVIEAYLGEEGRNHVA